MNLSPRWREALWWGEVGPPDEVLFAWARESGYIILTADLDFSRLLALTGSKGPSVILLRRSPRRPWSRFWRFGQALEEGAIGRHPPPSPLGAG
ncbi:DUF5615 family PIN-like protein [Thermus oshimai]|uniref:DUF5615 family PIN-like protein n=1 Tax=Thermus oshimai TaxID=56957 RepID=UPI001FE05CD9